MRGLLAVAALAAVALSMPADVKEAPALTPENLASYNYAVDLAALTSQNTFSCLRGQGYQTAFVRVYSPLGNGAFDSNGCQNVKNAYAAGMGIEVYMTPAPASTKPGYTQFDEVYQGLTNAAITVRSVWIQVTSPINWSTTIQQNINFIQSIIARGQQYNIHIGIYTNYYDWQQITGGWTGACQSTSLWYWNVRGPGVSGETPADFSDYSRFGGWSQPAVKQYGQAEPVCSVTLNRDVYPVGSKVSAAVAAKKDEIVVGGLGF